MEKLTGWIITIVLMFVIGITTYLDNKKIIDACHEGHVFTLKGHDYFCYPKRW